MSRNETRSSQLGLISGIRQPQSDMVLVAEPSALFAPEARKGQLYIVAEAEGDLARGHDACQIVLRAIRKIFYEDSSYSITAALRKAILAANKALYEHNFGVPAQKRAIVGVSCAVIKDHDLYLAQVLPGQAYLLAEGKLRALPTHSSWNPTQAGTTTFIKPGAIGSSLTVEPEFYRAVLRPGDMALLCSSNLSRLLGRDDVLRLARLSDPESITDELAGMCKREGLTDAQAIAATHHAPLSPAAQAAPLSRAGVSERGWLALRAVSGWAARMTGEAVLLVKGSAAREQIRKDEARRERASREQAQLQDLPDEPRYPTQTAPRPRPLDMGEPLDERVGQARATQTVRLGMPAVRPPDETSLPPSAFLGEGSYAAPAPRERRIDLSDTPGMAALGRPYRSSAPEKSRYDMTIGERLAQPFARVGAALGGISHRRLLRQPPPSAMPQIRRQQGLSYRRQRPPFPYLLLLLLISLVTLLVVYGRSLTDQNAQRAADDSLARAEQAVAAVRAAPDNAVAEQRLSGAAAALAEVRASGLVTTTQENRIRYDQLQQEYERALAAIQKLTYFGDLTEIAQHPVVGGEFSGVVVPPPPQGITDTGGFTSIYVLDSNAGVLYRLPKTGGALETFLRPDDSVDGLTVGAVRSHAWRVDNIIAVSQNSEGGPFTFYFRGDGRWRYSNLAGSSEWGRVGKRFHAVNYEGNLYIWGAQPGQVLKYASGHYGDFPIPWITDESRKTENAIDVAVDGKIYLLQTNGHILVYSAGVFEREIELTGINPPLVTPAGFYVTTSDPDSGAIFLVDTTNERIIQIDKQTGAFIQQVRARPSDAIRLNQLSSVYVDENATRPTLYLINGGQILRAALPDPPRPFREATPGPAPTAAPTAIP
jgi:serine/threonine protein phosphatase PrpC